MVAYIVGAYVLCIYMRICVHVDESSPAIVDRRCIPINWNSPMENYHLENHVFLTHSQDNPLRKDKYNTPISLWQEDSTIGTPTKVVDQT